MTGGQHLDALEAILRKGQRESMQGSYERRLPAAESLPSLEESRMGIRGYLNEFPDNVRALRLLSEVEETLLNYPAAVTLLERAMELEGRRTKKDLKRITVLIMRIALV